MFRGKQLRSCLPVLNCTLPSFCGKRKVRWGPICGFPFGQVFKGCETSRHVQLPSCRRLSRPYGLVGCRVQSPPCYFLYVTSQLLSIQSAVCLFLCEVLSAVSIQYLSCCLLEWEQFLPWMCGSYTTMLSFCLKYMCLPSMCGCLSPYVPSELTMGCGSMGSSVPKDQSICWANVIILELESHIRVIWSDSCLELIVQVCVFLRVLVSNKSSHSFMRHHVHLIYYQAISSIEKNPHLFNISSRIFLPSNF